MTDPKHLGDRLWQIYCGNPWYGPGLMRALDGVDFTLAASRPIKGCHSIWEIVLHIDAWHHVFIKRISGIDCPAPEQDFPTPIEVTAECWAADLDRLKESTAGCVQRIASLGLEDLSKPGPGHENSFLALCEHMVYHAGQISLLRKAGSQPD